MDEREDLSQTKWECKHDVVFIPKRRRQTLYTELRRHVGEVFRKLAEQRESRIEEGHLLPDPVPRMIAILPKHAVSQVIGFIKRKGAIHLARVYGERKRNFAGQSFWARGYSVSTAGRDEAVIREYIRNQEARRPAAGAVGPVALRRRRPLVQRNRGRASGPASPLLIGEACKVFNRFNITGVRNTLYNAVTGNGTTPRPGPAAGQHCLVPHLSGQRDSSNRSRILLRAF